MSQTLDFPDEAIKSPESDEQTKINVLENSSVSKGDVLLTSVPFVYILKSSLRGLHCDTCLRKKQGAQRCSGCATAYYCNRVCQKSSWSTHKNECLKLKKLKQNFPPDTARLIARALFRLNDGGHDTEERINDVRSRKFEDLMSHVSEVREDPVRQEHFASLLVVLRGYLGTEVMPDVEAMMEIYGKLLVNSFTITDKDLNGVGTGVYLSASFVDHSCAPNAYASFVGTKLVLRSLQDVQNFQWNKVRISYIDVLNPVCARREELERGYFFTCDCPHCRDGDREKVMSSLACGNKDCSEPVYINEDSDLDSPVGACPSCGFAEFGSGTRAEYARVVALTKETLRGTKDKNYFETCQSLVSAQASVLHPLNVWRGKACDALFESAIHFTTWECALDVGCRNLEGLKFYYGPSHPVYGLSLLKLGKIGLYLFRLQEALSHLEVAEPVLRVTHGQEHPLYCEDLVPLLNQARQEIKMMRSNGFDVGKGGGDKKKAILT